MLDWDVVILGAGAAGLCAAIRAAERGARVLVVEKNRRPGVKILMSGGTRCNITNARGLRSLRGISGPIDPAYDPREAQGARSIQQAFGGNGKFLGPALKALSVEDTIGLFEAEGVATKIEGNGKVFPVSDRATDVLDALVRRLRRTTAVLLRCETARPSAVEPRATTAFGSSCRAAIDDDARGSSSRSAGSPTRGAERSATATASPDDSVTRWSKLAPRSCRFASRKPGCPS